MNRMNQERAPLVEALSRYVNKEYLSYHMPGHKGGTGIARRWRDFLGEQAFSMDLTEVDELDDLHSPAGPIKEAQELAASLMEAEAAYFLVNGVTGGIHAAIMAACRKKKIIIPRHAHRSVYGGMILAGAEPVYLSSLIHPFWGIPVGVSLSEVCAVLEDNRNCGCLIMVHPTYHGLTSDMSSIVRSAREKNVLVLADEAHGAHFGFSSKFPETAIRSGAAVSVQGWHKTMGSLTQSGMLLVNDKELLRIFDYLNLLQTTSPSYLLMGSLDIVRKFWAMEGQNIASELADLANYFRNRIKKLQGIVCLNKDALDCGVVTDQDTTRVVLNSQGIGLNGFQLAQELRETYRIQPEMAEYGGVTLMITVGDTKEKVDLLASALEDLCGRFQREKGGNPTFWPGFPQPDIKLLPGKALQASKRTVNFRNAADEISGEFICPYPPGIPLVVPGEKITREILEIIQLIKFWGGKIQGPEDSSGITVRVIAE